MVELILKRILKKRWDSVNWIDLAQVGDRWAHSGFFVGKIEKKRPLGRPRCRWGVNISVYLKKKDGIA